MSETAEERVLRILPHGTAESRGAGRTLADDGGWYQVFDRPYGEKLGMGPTRAEAWEAAERLLLTSRYYLDDQGMPRHLAADDPDSGLSYTKITAAEFYDAMAARTGK